MFHKILILLQQHFNATPKEARGYVVLIIMSFCLLLLPVFFRSCIIPVVYDPGVVISGTPLIKSDSTSRPQYATATDMGGSDNSVSKTSRLFDFDPNLVTVEEMEELGVALFLAKRIENFRSKGGIFREKQDLLKIYDFPATLYKTLEKHIVIESVRRNSSERVTIKSELITEGFTMKNEKSQKKETVRFDLNTVDSLQLIGIRGIGPVLSARILKYRQALGGFYSMEQLREVYKLDSLVIGEIARKAFINEPVSRFNINQSTASELLRHPYLRGKRKEIGILVNYIQNHGPLESEADLLRSKSLDSLTVQNILPYLAF